MKLAKLGSLLLFFFSVGCAATVSIQGAGKVAWDVLCDTDACGAQGQTFTPAKNAAQPLMIASVGQILGTKLPRDSIFANPDPCGGYASEAQWFASAPVDKVVTLTQQNKSDLKAGLKANLTKVLNPSSNTNVKANLEASIESATDKSVKSEYHYSLTTYTLHPDAYIDRVNVCKPIGNLAVVRSITIVQASGGATEDLKDSLQSSLKADGTVTLAIAGGSANVDATIDDATAQAVKTTLGDGTKSVIVVAFDK